MQWTSHGCTSQKKSWWNHLFKPLEVRGDSYPKKQLYKKQLYLKWKDIMTYHKIITKPCKLEIYIYRYTWNLFVLCFGGLNPPKEGTFQPKQGSFGFQVYPSSFRRFFSSLGSQKKTNPRRPSERGNSLRSNDFGDFLGAKKWEALTNLGVIKSDQIYQIKKLVISNFKRKRPPFSLLITCDSGRPPFDSGCQRNF